MKNIVAKVSDIYMKYGIKSVTMDDVARELCISKKTLYQYFKNKDDLVKKVIQYNMSSMHNEMRKLISKKANAIEELLFVSKFISQYFNKINTSVTYDLQKYYPVIWKNINSDRRKHIYERIKDNMKKGIKEGLYRKDLNIEIIANFYLFRIEMSQTFDLVIENKYTFEELFNTSFNYHIRGIANHEGIKYLESVIK